MMEVVDSDSDEFEESLETDVTSYDDDDEAENIDYEIKGVKIVQNPYKFYGDNTSRGEARDPSVLLNDKMDFIPGRKRRAKEKQKQYRQTSHNENFIKTYNNMSNNVTQSADQVYKYLSAILPDFANRNVRILVAAYIIRETLKSQDNYDENGLFSPEDFEEILDEVWSSLTRSLSNASAASKRINKRVEPIPKKEEQKVDILRYIRAIDSFEKSYNTNKNAQ